MRQNDALLAKVRGRTGKRLLPADYTRMLILPDVDAVAKALAGYPAYAGIAPHLREGTLHRDYIESLLRQEYYDEFVQLYGYLNAEERELTRPVVWKYEISEILLFLHATHEKTAFVRFHNEKMDSFVCVDRVKIGTVQTTEDLLRALDGTGYDELLSPLTRDGRISYSEAENALYADYYKKCVLLVREKAPKDARRELERSIFLQPDLQRM